MKQAPIALVLASALFALCGAIFFARSSVDPVKAASAPSGDGGATAALEARLAEALEKIGGLEKALARLDGASRVARAASARARPSAGGEQAEESGAEAAEKAGEEKSLASAQAASGGDDLRSFVNQVIQEEREERRLEQQRRAKEQLKELEEMSQGPYGQFNYRVNTIAKKLGLSDNQKERYHAYLTDYSSRIEEIRTGLDRQDPAAYQAYRDRKKQIIDEFEGVVMHTLTPAQAQTYQGLPSDERSPADAAGGGGAQVMFSTVDGAGQGAIRIMSRAQNVLGGLTIPSAPGGDLGPLGAGATITIQPPIAPGTAPVKVESSDK